MSEAGSINPEERKRKAEARLERSRASREAAAAAHAISFHEDDIHKIKTAITRGAPYAGRISLGFAIRLFWLEYERREADNVLREIDFLEGLSTASITQSASQFKHAPLAPFWHKHFWSSRHLLRNIGNRWGIHPDKMAKKHRALDAMLSDIAREFGDNADLWQKASVYKLIVGAIEERTIEKRMTGDWIIYAQHDGQNYYLDIAEHEEGDDPQQLATKIRDGSQVEFPFLFS